MRVRSIALTWMRRTLWNGLLGSSRTVTCLPAIGEPSDAQFVASVSSINLAKLTPSPVAVAPRVLEATFGNSGPAVYSLTWLAFRSKLTRL